jgi:hypothetical protein
MPKRIAVFFQLSAALLFCASSAPCQKAPSDKTKPAVPSILTYDVQFEPDPKLSVPFQETGYPAIFAQGCDPHGNPYVQVNRIVPPNSIQVLKFDPDGLITFETAKITDIVEPKWISDFISESELYMLVEGGTHTEQRTKKTEDGKDEVYWEKTGEAKYYIAQFDSDGSYKGAMKLDLPFMPKKLSGFKSGSFLATGLDASNLPHVALLDPSGQWLRDIAFPKEQQEAPEKTAARSLGSNMPSAEFASAMLSEFASFFPYQSNILYVRGRTGAPIFEIHEGGDALPLKIKAPDGYSVEYFLPSDRNWFVVSTEQGKFTDAKSKISEVNPSTGETVARYIAEGAGGSKSTTEGQSDLACFQDGEFVSVRHQDGKLTVLHGTPVVAKKTAPPPQATP